MPQPSNNRLRTVSLLFLCAISFAPKINAQFNIFSGLTVAYAQNQSINQAIESYNTSPNLTKSLTPVNSLVGFQFGVRYQYEMIGISAGIHSRFKNIEGTKNVGSVDRIDKFKFRLNSFFVGPEIFIGDSPISLGANFGYDKYKIKFNDSDEADDINLIDQTGWSSHIFLAFNFDGGGMTKLNIRPYVELMLTEKDYSPLLNTLAPNAAIANSKFNQFGISLLFINGN